MGEKRKKQCSYSFQVTCISPDVNGAMSSLFASVLQKTFFAKLLLQPYTCKFGCLVIPEYELSSGKIVPPPVYVLADLLP